MRTRVVSAALFCVMAAIFLVELATGAIRNDARLLRLGALPNSGEIGPRVLAPDHVRVFTLGPHASPTQQCAADHIGTDCAAPGRYRVAPPGVPDCISS